MTDFGMLETANPLSLKLRYGTELNDEDERKLAQLCAVSRSVKAHQDVIREGDRPEDVHLVLEGFAVRYKLMPNGSRQILAVLLPGDFCDLHVALLGAMDHGIGTLTTCKIVDIPRSEIKGLVDHPRILHGFWWATLVDEAVLREWLVSMGQRNAERQMAHFFCEMFVRLGLIGRVERDSFELPMTQHDLGDTLGLSVVHVNRTLQDLRAAGLIEAKRTRYQIPHATKLFEYASFSPNYLHLVKRRESARSETPT